MAKHKIVIDLEDEEYFIFCLMVRSKSLISGSEKTINDVARNYVVTKAEEWYRELVSPCTGTSPQQHVTNREDFAMWKSGPECQTEGS